MDPIAKRIVICWIATDVIWCSLLVWVLRQQPKR
jgi:hypothetical protein